MENPNIGIKIANGSFYPILQENTPGKKRLVLTTVNDSQTSVQIDLYHGEGDTMEDAAYIGSLMIEEIEEAPKGDPEIDLVIGIDAEGVLSASAGNNVTGDRQSLSVSLKALDSPETYDIPEFEVDESFEPELGMGDLDYEAPPIFVEEGEDFASEGEETAHEPEKRAAPWLLPLFILFGLIIIVLSAFLIHQLFEGEPVPPLEISRLFLNGLKAQIARIADQAVGFFRSI